MKRNIFKEIERISSLTELKLFLTKTPYTKAVRSKIKGKITYLRKDLGKINENHINFYFFKFAVLFDITDIDLNYAIWDENGRVIYPIERSNIEDEIIALQYSNSKLHESTELRGKNKYMKMFLKFGLEHTEFYEMTNTEILDYFSHSKTVHFVKKD